MNQITRNCLQRLPAVTAAVLVLLIAVPAYAHHPMGGLTPSTFVEGLLSGIGHPIIGIDHLAFVIGIGLAASFLSRGLAMPAFFVGATLLGTGIHLLAVNLPIVEVVISASVLLLGVMIATKRSQPPLIWASLFVVAGIFHGYAYGEAIVSAESTPLVAYLVGFAITQYLVAGAAFLIARKAQDVVGAKPVGTRIGGSFVAGVGFVFLFTAVAPF
ncbi:MAG: HupE/UreJ family protein [Alphaproteobacteria bacterium]|nr:HupE/UreJ family protein [Alphaproteobacteria bacterium]